MTVGSQTSFSLWGSIDSDTNTIQRGTWSPAGKDQRIYNFQGTQTSYVHTQDFYTNTFIGTSDGDMGIPSGEIGSGTGEAITDSSVETVNGISRGMNTIQFYYDWTSAF